jgi:hypothetical protein
MFRPVNTRCSEELYSFIGWPGRILTEFCQSTAKIRVAAAQIKSVTQIDRKNSFAESESFDARLVVLVLLEAQSAILESW